MLYPTWLGKWGRIFSLINTKLWCRYPVIDGTYLVADQLQLNGTSPIANVHAHNILEYSFNFTTTELRTSPPRPAFGRRAVGSHNQANSGHDREKSMFIGSSVTEVQVQARSSYSAREKPPGRTPAVRRGKA